MVMSACVYLLVGFPGVVPGSSHSQPAWLYLSTSRWGSLAWCPVAHRASPRGSAPTARSPPAGTRVRSHGRRSPRTHC